MVATTPAKAYIVAARRSALGRIGGLHRSRRLETLAAPILEAALADSGLSGDRVDEIILGNATAGGNPARLLALSAGLPETVAAATVDRQCGSGLDAILNGLRIVASGDADVVVAGGAESLSTAPWRIAKPKNLYQLPHFIGVEPSAEETSGEPRILESSEALASTLGITREQQDAYAYRAHLKAQKARDDRRFLGEIVPLKANADESRDQVSGEPEPDDLEDMAPILTDTGTLTAGNTSPLNDGAAIVVIVSEAVWSELGRPPALQLVASAAQGVAPRLDAAAPIEAVRKLYGRLNGFDRSGIGVVEMSETSAAQAIAFSEALAFDDTRLNPDGGAIVRGHPFGAAGAVLVVRLFTHMIRGEGPNLPKYGLATLGTVGGMGLAALFARA